jgi:phospholipid/cholesterol/gamma-HCH transport system substrate-binding protein
MSASPNRQAVVVGLFVLAAVGILTGGILTIGDLNDTFTKKLTVTAVFDEVNGLQEGDNIWFSGVKVGIVKDLAFQEGSRVLIEMKVDRKASEFIREDALAKIGSDGLIGNKIVVLYGGTPGAPHLEDGDVLLTEPAVSSEALMAMLQENNTNLLAITTDLKDISGKIAKGEGTVGKLLMDEALYTNVNGTVTTLGVASTNAQNATGSLSAFAGKLNKEGSLPNQLVTDKTTYPALTGAVGKLNDASGSASELMAGIAKGAANPNTPIGTLVNDEPAGADLKVTLANLSQGTVLLNEDLEALQHNFLTRPYFKKKERAAKKAEAQAKRDAKNAE